MNNVRMVTITEPPAGLSMAVQRLRCRPMAARRNLVVDVYADSPLSTLEKDDTGKLSVSDGKVIVAKCW